MVNKITKLQVKEDERKVGTKNVSEDCDKRRGLRSLLSGAWTPARARTGGGHMPIHGHGEKPLKENSQSEGKVKSFSLYCHFCPSATNYEPLGVQNWVNLATTLGTCSSGWDRPSGGSGNSSAVKSLLKASARCDWRQRATWATHCPLKTFCSCLRWRAYLFLHIVARIGWYNFPVPGGKSELWMTTPRTHYSYPLSDFLQRLLGATLGAHPNEFCTPCFPLLGSPSHTSWLWQLLPLISLRSSSPVRQTRLEALLWFHCDLHFPFHNKHDICNDFFDILCPCGWWTLWRQSHYVSTWKCLWVNKWKNRWSCKLFIRF